MPSNDRKSTQRERLIAGMIVAANRDGYAGANVSAVIANAGVSRPTFYDYFTDRDDCFLATHRSIATDLLQQVRRALTAETPERAIQTGIRTLIALAESAPEKARFLTNETMAGGPRTLNERDKTITQLEQIIDRRLSAAAAGAIVPDLPTRALLGSIQWLLAPRLRRGEHDLTRHPSRPDRLGPGLCTTDLRASLAHPETGPGAPTLAAGSGAVAASAAADPSG